VFGVTYFEGKPWNDSKVKGFLHMRIGELAKQSGVSADTIRYYERIGLMPKPARTSSGYREYGESAIGRVRLVQNSLRFGFSLKQVGAFLETRQAGRAPCKQVRAAGTQILEAIERQITELTAARESIRETLERWDQRLSQTPEGRPAHLLEALPVGAMQTPARRRLPISNAAKHRNRVGEVD
jgi:DNA-binding transcriptional MerR regulator